MQQQASVFAEAQGTGEILRVRYHGGTQPGAVRDLQVLQFSGEHFLALCLSSHAVKTFRVDRAEVVDADAVEPTYAAGSPASVPFRTVPELAQVLAPLLARPEWHVEVSPMLLAVCGRFKNGKPRKTPLVSLEVFEAARPFVVRVKGEGRAYGSLAKAAERFLHHLKLEPPWPVAARTPKPPRKRGWWPPASNRRDAEEDDAGTTIVCTVRLEPEAEVSVETVKAPALQPASLWSRLAGWLRGGAG